MGSSGSDQVGPAATVPALTPPVDTSGGSTTATTAPTQTTAPATHTIDYWVYQNGCSSPTCPGGEESGSATVTYLTAGGPQQQTGLPIPANHWLDVGPFTVESGQAVSLIADSATVFSSSPSPTLECVIKIDGVVLVSNISHGDFAVANCSGIVP